MGTRAIGIVLAMAALLLGGREALAAEKARAAAIFDFGMKAGGEEWGWLEKGLADMFTTHFVRRGVPVVARDEMEALVTKMGWTPELAEKKRELEEIKKQLKVSYLVTGVYAMKGDQITITAQIVSVETRKEVFRKEISGGAEAVLELQAKLAAELIPFFGGGVKGEVLPELVPWTKSIPAAKALYQGVHLYDQGRYGEAWLCFRRAAANDREYHDAAYWVARMYYYMDQFEHARLAYEKFIYSDTTHPRAGDAIREYLHTFESLRPAPEALLKLYARLSAAYPKLMIDFGKFRAPVPNERWLQVREAQLRGQLGEHKRAVELAAPEGLTAREGSEVEIAGANAKLHNMLSGEVVLPSLVSQERGADHHIAFTPERREITIKPNSPTNSVDYYVVSVPSGYVFKSLRAYLIADDSATRIGMHLHRDVVGDVPTASMSRAFSRAIEEGFPFDNLPPSGFFSFHYWLMRSEEGGDRPPNVKGLRLVAELEKLGPHGALDVSCENTGDFRVDVDGKMGRWGSGLVGLLPVGEHTVRFYSRGKIVVGSARYPRTAFGEWTTKVTVKEGAVTKVVGRLPLAEDSAFSAWSPGTRVGTGYPGYYLGTHSVAAKPSVQMDRGAIRLVWSYMGDLWWSESRDGERYSTPEKFPLPISTAAIESEPRLLLDESGRFVLVFMSDRNALHERRAYVSWSRDFKHWSAPAMILDRAVGHCDIMQDQLGRFLFVDATGPRVTISESRDVYRWTTMSGVAVKGIAGPARLVQTADGRFDLFAVQPQKVEKPESEWNNSIADNVGAYHSVDGVTWTEREELVQMESNRAISLSVLQPPGRQILAYFTHANRYEPVQLQMQERVGRKYGAVTPGMGGVASPDATLGYHPKWGYVMAWSTSRGFWWGDTFEGPFVMRGPSLDPVIEKLRATPAESAPASR